MEQKPIFSSGFTGRQLIAIILIACGVLLLGRNFGIIPYDFFNVIVSWPMLLVVFGVYSALRKQTFGGLILFAIGLCFLIPRLGWFNWFSIDMKAVLWPVVLVLIGVAFFTRPRGSRGFRRRCNMDIGSKKNCKSTDGFMHSDNLFSGVKQVVLDDVFKGASIRNNFGGTVLDLRRTTIVSGETYIDLECNFGGVEIYVPLDWKVEIQVNAFLGGCEDKRFPGINVDQSRVLVIRGNVSFGGVEVKG